MKYTDALEYIDECNRIRGSVLGLDNILELLKRLDNPQNKLKVIHVAGTNGKGSICAYLTEIFISSGIKVGRYVSPTIIDYRERFTINGKMISQAKTASYIEKMKAVCEKMVEDGYEHPTAFEIETAIAYLYFFEQKCEVVIIETGMGGRLDATNVCENVCLSILASISMDHMAFLGDTLEKIAFEKCGIIKEGCPVLSTKQDGIVTDVIKKCAEEKDTEVVFADSTEVKFIKYATTKQTFKYKGNAYSTGMLGSYQIDNAVVAIEAANILYKAGFAKICYDSIYKGLANAVWQGRFSTVRKKPLTIVDGAHNENAAKRLRESIDIYFSNKKKIYIVGMFRDKEVEKVIEQIVADGECIFTVATPNNSRAMSSVELAEIVRKYNPNVTSTDSVEEALEFATAIADNDCVIIASGSLSYLGRIINACNIK